MSINLSETQTEIAKRLEALEKDLKSTDIMKQWAALKEIIRSGDLQLLIKALATVTPEARNVWFQHIADAIHFGQLPILKYLLSQASPKNFSFEDLLLYVALYAEKKGYWRLEKCLIQAGLNVNERLKSMVGYQDYKRILPLIQLGADPRYLSPEENSCMLALGSALPFDPGRMKPKDFIDIHKKDKKMTQTTTLLLKLGCDLDRGKEPVLHLIDTWISGYSLFMSYKKYQMLIAARECFKEIYKENSAEDLKRFNDILEILGDGLNARITGKTALHCAVEQQDKFRVAALLNAGADVHMLNDNDPGQSPLDLAVKSKNAYLILLCYTQKLLNQLTREKQNQQAATKEVVKTAQEIANEQHEQTLIQEYSEIIKMWQEKQAEFDAKTLKDDEQQKSKDQKGRSENLVQDKTEKPTQKKSSNSEKSSKGDSKSEKDRNASSSHSKVADFNRNELMQLASTLTTEELQVCIAKLSPIIAEANHLDLDSFYETLGLFQILKAAKESCAIDDEPGSNSTNEKILVAQFESLKRNAGASNVNARTSTNTSVSLIAEASSTLADIQPKINV